MDAAIVLCQWLSNKIEYNIRAASQILQPDNTNAISSQKKENCTSFRQHEPMVKFQVTFEYFR